MPLRAWNLWPERPSYVHVPVVHVDGHGAHGLHRIGVEQHTRFMGDFADLADGPDGADLLLAAMMEMRTVSGRMAFFTSSTLTRPFSSTGR